MSSLTRRRFLGTSALALGAMRAGLSEPAIYDGSWTEWAGRPDTQKVTA